MQIQARQHVSNTASRRHLTIAQDQETVGHLHNFRRSLLQVLGLESSFDEVQFESYRELGFRLCHDMLRTLVPGEQPARTFADLIQSGGNR